MIVAGAIHDHASRLHSYEILADLRGRLAIGRDVTVEEINAALKAAADGPMKGVLFTTTEPLVSSDLNHIAASSTAALPQTQVVDGRLARVLSWYDNEWGFATRMSDTAMVMAKFL